MMKKALIMYKGRHDHSFSYIDCYDELAKCPKFQQAIAKLGERKQNTHNNKRKEVDGANVEASDIAVESQTQSFSTTTSEARLSQGIKAAKMAKVEASMQARTVIAQEALSKSVTSRVLKEQLQVNQALQRLQEKEVLHRMRNETFSIRPSGPEQAAYL
ncbi:unnamed protein product [Phytophthora lilii]|uniref:Unnamed protein product n=1 Tax=Phytophthora lilii TaxID=2077276 RepID=A0A9W6X740_9STRA|nr:unnamed protein product [Phytophthora lilii]